MAGVITGVITDFDDVIVCGSKAFTPLTPNSVTFCVHCVAWNTVKKPFSSL